MDFINSWKKQKFMEKTGLMYTEAIEVFEYEKNYNVYWDEAKLNQQVVNKTLSIAEALYLDYPLSIFFDNMSSHSI